MKTSLRQWGNSFGVRIPRKILDEVNLKPGDDLEIITINGGIVLQSTDKKSFRDIARPLISTEGWKFDRDDANAR